MSFVPIHVMAAKKRARGGGAPGDDAPDREHPEHDDSGLDDRQPIALAVVAAAVAVAVIVAALLFLARTAAAQDPPGSERGAFVLIRGTDTLAVEQFIRTRDALQASLHGAAGSNRVGSFTTIAPGELTTSFTLSVWAPTAPADGPPTQRFDMQLRGDTVVAQTPAGTQRIPTRYGAIFFLNGSLAATEVATRRARGAGSAGGTAEIPFFNAGNGATFNGAVAPLGADSMLVTLAGQVHRLAVDQVGRILGGAIPSQRVQIVRLGAEAAAGLTFAPPAALDVPRPDYSAPANAPYAAEDVVVPGPHGIRLGGTLTKPRGAGPFPVVVTISGSGQQDRDEFIPFAGGIRLFRAIADTLGRRGIAVLRLDDRGLGASGGDATKATTADFADDVRAALAYLRTRADVDRSRIALLGHSEGGVIAPMIAADDPALRAIILLAGTASTGLDVIRMQQRYAIDRMPSIAPAQRDSAYAVAEKQLVATARANPWMHFFMDYDPAAAARKVKAPVLIVQGATDRQVPQAEAEKLAAYVRAGGNKDVTVRILPDVNHLFVADPDGDFARYDTLPSNAISPAALGAIADWAAEKLGTAPARP